MVQWSSLVYMFLRSRIDATLSEFAMRRVLFKGMALVNLVFLCCIQRWDLWLPWILEGDL